MTMPAASPMDRSKERTIQQLLEQSPEPLLGRLAGRYRRFPLLLKFLDASEMVSVQVHPSDRQTDYLPAGESGKTEAWVVLEAGPDSRIFAGLQPGSTADVLRRALADKTVADHLASFTPRPGDAVFLRAGTVHSLGGGVVVFEVQENSDVTFRLYDWDRIDARTGQPRSLQVDQALACFDRRANRGRSGDAGGARQQRRCCESDSFTMNIFHCGGSREDCRSPSARQVRRVCWYVSAARESWSTRGPFMLSAKAT